MPSTYTPIATQTLGSSTRSVTLSSIPGTYTDLILVIRGSAAPGANVLMTFNGDTATNYSTTYILGNGSSAVSGRFVNQSAINSDTFYSNSMSILNIMNYSNTTTYKTVLSRVGDSADNTRANVGLWRSTAAINSINLVANENNYGAGTSFTLYGIQAA